MRESNNKKQQINTRKLCCLNFKGLICFSNLLRHTSYKLHTCYKSNVRRKYIRLKCDFNVFYSVQLSFTQWRRSCLVIEWDE